MRCAGFLHKQNNYRFKQPKCKEKESDGSICGARHLTELHGCDHSTVLALSIAAVQPAIAAAATSRPLYTFTESSALLATVRVPDSTGKVNVLLLCVEGAQVSLVRHSTAKRLGAGPGTPWTLSIQVVGDEFRNLPTKLYHINLMDSCGRIRSLVAAGIDDISSTGHPPDLGAVLQNMPGTCPEALIRPQGDIDILIGACDARFSHFGGITVGNLRLEDMTWGCGKVLWGYQPVPISKYGAPAHTCSTGSLQGDTTPTA